MSKQATESTLYKVNRVDMEKKSVSEIIEEICEDICDNYCKYRDSTDEECLCDVLRDGRNCPLDRLH